ncbi:MAG: glycosyltransferase family 2 protein [Candidatus Omnitrophica bacterium]|nr:glycosyltransferase family 2 protein [Candidatus Omnitrophota bacterium]
MSILCDLVLLSWNHLEETKPCLESLFEHTDVPCRLFIVDNGSEPHVRQFLQSVRPRGEIREVVLLQNEANEGFPKGMNRGLCASSAPYACLLNNDLIFTPGWLSRMIDFVQAHPEIGLANPTSSNFGNYPPHGVSLNDYAVQLAAKLDVYVEVGVCIGFCLLITRQVMQRIGVLSEEVERMFFEDEDYSMRAQAAGFQCVVVESAYVFHGEHKSVRDVPEREALFQRNQRWCHGKWGPWRRIALVRMRPFEPGSDELRRFLEQALAWMRRRSFLYFYGPIPAGISAPDLFRSVGLVPHANMMWHDLSGPSAPWIATWKILKRQKKRFDTIVVPTPSWTRWMRWLQPLHRATVVNMGDTKQVLKIGLCPLGGADSP